jgi:NAD-dependent SIR2 family protein deacetylase
MEKGEVIIVKGKVVEVYPVRRCSRLARIRKISNISMTLIRINNSLKTIKREFDQVILEANRKIKDLKAFIKSH